MNRDRETSIPVFKTDYPFSAGHTNGSVYDAALTANYVEASRSSGRIPVEDGRIPVEAGVIPWKRVQSRRSGKSPREMGEKMVPYKHGR